MAKKRREKQNDATADKLFCGQCKHHYDEHEKDYNGNFFLARCPFKKYSVFMESDRCEKFELMKA